MPKSTASNELSTLVENTPDYAGFPIGSQEPPAPSFWSVIRADYRRHGSTLANGAFVSLAVYRFGRWSLQCRSKFARVVFGKIYASINVVVSNITKIWMPAQVTIGEDFHIIHNEGSLSIHPKVVIGDRFGVMHNVTIGTNMRDDVPTIGDDVFIGVNSTVLGGIHIGDRVRIGANCSVTTDIPSDSIVMCAPNKVYPRLGSLN